MARAGRRSKPKRGIKCRAVKSPPRDPGMKPAYRLIKRSLLLQLTIPALALGQESELFRARSLQCSFTAYVSVAWGSDQPDIRPPDIRPEFPNPDIIRIENIDYRAGTATLMDRSGPIDLVVIRGTTIVSFVYADESSFVVRTVYDSRDRLGRFKTAGARHLTLFSPAPSQAFGYCEAQR